MALSRDGLIFTGIALVSAAVGFFLYQQFSPEPTAATSNRETPQTTTSVLGQPIPAVTLPNPEGETQTLSQWKGQPLLINFWATWCPPCREEIPDLIALQREFQDQGVVVIGIALDEARHVARFIQEFGIDYPVFVEPGRATQMNAAFGNPLGVLPYTVYVDSQGRIRKTHRGALSREQGRKDLQDLLRAQPLTQTIAPRYASR